MLLVKFTEDYYGSSGLYVASLISGMTDVDAITLSMAKMSHGSIDNSVAINSILIAALSNTAVKFSIAFFAGSKLLKKHISIGFGVIFLVGLLVLALRVFIF